MKNFSTNISLDKSADLVQKLQDLAAAAPINCDSEKSCEVGFLLQNGNLLKFGVNDFGEDGKLWVKILEKICF